MKKFNVLTSMLFVIFLQGFTVLQAQTLNDGLVLYLPLNGNANDSSQYANNGINYNCTPTIDRFGGLSKAMYFTNDSYIEIPGKPELNLTKNKTVSCWIKIPSSESLGWYPTILHKDEPLMSCTYTLCLTEYYGYNEKRYKTDFMFASNYTHYQIHTKQLYTADYDKWFNITATYDTLSGYQKIYYNGEISDSVNIGKIVSNSSNLSLYVGRGKDNASLWRTFFKGALDDIRIYNRALSSKEIKDMYNISILNSFTNTQSLEIQITNTDSKKIQIINLGQCEKTINVFDICGKKTYSCMSTQNKLIIDKIFNTGVYLVSVSNSKGDILKTQKLRL